jgi:small-conductance mechanosensitive channel
MLELLRTTPLWVILGAIAVLALSVAFVALTLLRSWLRRVATRSPSHFTEVLATGLPRPVASAVFLFEVHLGLRWLPAAAPLEAVTKHLLPFVIGMLIVITVTRLARKAIDSYGRSNPALRSSAGIAHAVIWLICLCAIALLASDALGVSLAPALTALGVGSLAVALALQDTLSNFFSGIYLLVDKPVRPGEFVRLEPAHEGYVEAIGWRSTQLRTLAGSTVIVPNATLAKGVITNFRDQNPRLSLELRVEVAEEADADAVEKALAEEAARAADLTGVKREPAPYVRFVPGFGQGALAFRVHVTIEANADGTRVEHEMNKRVLARLRKERIALAPAPVAAKT